jgi:hypothetical protein
MADTLQSGERVTWLYESRGGYGYVTPVPATVVRVSAQRVTIDAALKNGGSRRVSVKRANIRRIGDSV